MNEQTKVSKRIKIIAAVMFIFGLIMLGVQLRFLFGKTLIASEGYKIASYASAVAELIFIAPIFIIASIGLWSARKWGLFAALIAFGSRISMDLIWTPMDIMFLKTGEITYNVAVIWGIITVFIMIFAIIGIGYLWKERNYFL